MECEALLLTLIMNLTISTPQNKMRRNMSAKFLPRLNVLLSIIRFMFGLLLIVDSSKTGTVAHLICMTSVEMHITLTNVIMESSFSETGIQMLTLLMLCRSFFPLLPMLQFNVEIDTLFCFFYSGVGWVTIGLCEKGAKAKLLAK